MSRESQDRLSKEKNPKYWGEYFSFALEYVEEVMSYLKNEIYFRVGVSPIEGVGLIAIKDIPKNTDLCVEFGKDVITMLPIDRMKKELHPGVTKMYNDYFDNDTENQLIHIRNSSKAQMTSYINHSDTPNCIVTKDNFYNHSIISILDIREGEELTIDYYDTEHKKYEGIGI